MTISPEAKSEMGEDFKTLNRAIEEASACPDIAEQLKSRGPVFTELAKLFCGLLPLMLTVGRRAEASNLSVAYAPFLIERGVEPRAAHFLASLTISVGRRRAKISRTLPGIARSVQFLAGPSCNPLSIRERAEVILLAWEETPVIDAAFRDAGLGEGEFIELLKCAAEGGHVDRCRVAEIARAVTPHLKVPRGPKLSVASAAHETFLGTMDGLVKHGYYTWNSIDSEFSDALTRATRLEFGAPNFDPRPAYRRLRLCGRPKERLGACFSLKVLTGPLEPDNRPLN
jgi:hypothetical protein